MKKKILFLATHAYPLFNPKDKSSFGGSELQLYTIAKELVKECYEISFIVGDFSQKKYEYYNSIKLVRTSSPKSGSSLIKFFQALQYFLTLVKENPAICITSSANSTVGVVGIYCTLFRKKHIHRIANIIDTNMYWIKQNGILGKVYKYGLEHADHVICQTNEQKRELKKNHNINATIFRNVFEFYSKKKRQKKKNIHWDGRSYFIKRKKYI